MSVRGLMIQGTASSAGKSVIVAGICRALRREGYDVAPFKPQNMSNNAAVCADGGEIGRAQALQARAAGLAPTVDMNPVLLKPEGNEGSQVIVHGRPWGKVDGRNFLQVRAALKDAVMESFGRLADQHDVIIVEGAGSPAEINLREGDIANMGFAEMADLPVVVVGDVDKGGVFASLVGTLALLSDGERARIKGFLINKFRGTRALLDPGLRDLERRTGKPVLGVIPFLDALRLPEEDGFFIGGAGRRWPKEAAVRIGVVALPHLSNASDFDPLASAPGAAVRYVFRPADVDECKALVLPGTKNTVADLVHLHESGMAEAVRGFSRRGGAVAGICGGYQIMGERVLDPEGVESNLAGAPGLGLLPVETVLTSRKVTGEAWGMTRRGFPVSGYEIHAGRTAHVDGGGWFARLTRGTTGEVVEDGCTAEGGRIWGTYLHGVFDSEGFRRPWLKDLGADLPGVPEGARDPVEEGLDLLADALVRETRWTALKEVMGLVR
jgi:adenosylcobyric acid synthase